MQTTDYTVLCLMLKGARITYKEARATNVTCIEIQIQHENDTATVFTFSEAGKLLQIISYDLDHVGNLVRE